MVIKKTFRYCKNNVEKVENSNMHPFRCAHRTGLSEDKLTSGRLCQLAMIIHQLLGNCQNALLEIGVKNIAAISFDWEYSSAFKDESRPHEQKNNSKFRERHYS